MNYFFALSNEDKSAIESIEVGELEQKVQLEEVTEIKLWSTSYKMTQIR